MTSPFDRPGSSTGYSPGVWSTRDDPAPATEVFDEPMLKGRPDCSVVMPLSLQLPKIASAVDPFSSLGRSQTKELTNRCVRVRSELPREKKKLNGLLMPRLPPNPLRET